MKQRRLFAFLFAVCALLWAGSVFADGKIRLVTGREIGQKIEMDIQSEGDFTIEGLEGNAVQGRGLYTVKSEEIVINGDIVTFACNDGDLTEIDVTQCPGLGSLQVQINKLTALDVTQNKDLLYLYCSFNEITALDISKNTNLSILQCQSNKIKTLDVSRNKALTSLDCGFNQLSSLDASNLDKLEALYCDKNALQTLDCGPNLELSELDCGSNQLIELDVARYTALTELHCGNNQLRSLEVSANRNLVKLYCGGNALTSINIDKNTSLMEFDCGVNQITELNVSKNTRLTSLYCDKNLIRGDKMDAFIASLADLSKKSSKGTLFVYNNTEQNEGNVCTTEQVQAAAKRGWTAKELTTEGWVEYAGSNPTGIESLADATSSRVQAVFDLEGRRHHGVQRGMMIVRTTDGQTRKMLVP